MHHSPTSIAERAAPWAVGLAKRAIGQGKLVLYAGAGISLTPPTSLPSGRALANEVHRQLKAAFPVLETVDQDDLVAVADAVSAVPGGMDALLYTSVSSAQFKNAIPGYAHGALAHLMLEGAIEVLTTNWDTCIERAAGMEMIPTITNGRDLAAVTPPWVLKLHGCASKPESLLLTSAHLATPPVWVREQTHALLGSAVVVFVGIGDVAQYVGQRIREAIMDVGSIDRIRVVAPGIAADWDASAWSTLAADLAEEHKISETADSFMEELSSAYVRGCIEVHRVSLGSEDSLSDFLDHASDGLFASDALSVLEWARRSDISPRAGESVLRSQALASALLALGKKAGTGSIVRNGQVFETAAGTIELIVSTRIVHSRQLVEAAEYRLRQHANLGDTLPEFVVAGGIGPIVSARSLPNNIMDEHDASDVIDGPLALVPRIHSANEVIEA